MDKEVKRDWKIGLGFIVEIFLFILTGIFLAYGSLFCIIIFIAGLLVAFKVGHLIEKKGQSKK